MGAKPVQRCYGDAHKPTSPTTHGMIAGLTRLGSRCATRNVGNGLIWNTDRWLCITNPLFNNGAPTDDVP
jgi:hypothetical protein